MGWIRRVEDLHTTLYAREQIGVATGILMERHRLSRERAFSLLVRVSQTGKATLREVAASILEEATRAADADRPPAD
jgi:AmiR/NasT family two-component response regulator